MKTITYRIADQDHPMYHPTTFDTKEEAIEVMDKEYTNRNEGDGHDEYWRNRHNAVERVTTIVEVIKSNKPINDYKTFWEIIVLNSIDLEAYDLESVGVYEDVQAVYKEFLEVNTYNISKYGEIKAFSEWLRGLPNILSVPFENVEILELAKSEGLLSSSATNNEEFTFLDSYFIRLAHAFFTLKYNL